MLRKRKKILAQSTLEYAVLIVLVVVALLATQIYIKRALQGRFRSTAEDIGEQFSPGASNVFTTVNASSATHEVSNAVGSSSTLTAPDVSNRIVNTAIEAFNSTNEYWGTCGNGHCDPGENHSTCPQDCP